MSCPNDFPLAFSGGDRIFGFLGNRAVAQLGSALEWGSRGRGFESRRPEINRLSLDLQANYVIYSCGIGASAGNEFLGVLVTSVSVSAEIRYSSRRIRMQFHPVRRCGAKQYRRWRDGSGSESGEI